MTQFLSANSSELAMKTWEHFYISVIAVILGILVAVPLGIVLTRTKKAATVVMGVAGVIQTFPSLAILAFFIPILGVGKVPAIIALFFYSLLPILRNTYTGVKEVKKSLVESAIGMGMTNWERVRYVEAPLAIPVIMSGIRLSTVYLIGWATLASFIGAGGLGDYIFSGLNLYETSYIIAGAIPVTIMAFTIDLLLGLLEGIITPKGIRTLKETA